ncbi:protein-glutamate O-methyltransferase CheR [Limnohabitans sp. B9-3]|uniref:CheR family methyltransferase n=1 Tax=Limnohabitans sp. B9-3 TaxID=1100707 RepID=UPI001303FDB9|nr:protein-glutamate O-methyltransferase CheR [Limnohabitans sp. B9-3]
MFKSETVQVWPETGPFLEQVEQHLGLALGLEKQYLVASRLQPIARARGMEDWRALLRSLSQSPVGELHWACFEAMTTQETRFFRDDFCFETLRHTVLPEVLERARSRRVLKVWSAGTSTGQEACSLAILLYDHFPEVRDWQVQIWATDICEQTLAQAQAARYSGQELDKGLSSEQKSRHFLIQPDGHFSLAPQLKRWIGVARHNLLDPVPETGFDLVLLRNVLIYFRANQKSQVLRCVHQSMSAAGASLILGASETIFEHDLFIQHKAARGGYFTRHDKFS